MPPLSARFPYRRSRSSSALVITLAFVAFICILLVGFVSSMSSDAIAARFHLDGVRAQFYAQEGSDIALARLRTVATNTVWASQPGRAVVMANATETVFDLSSGATTVTEPGDAAADLNPKSFESGPARLIAPTNSPMLVKWIYLRRDGTRDKTVPPAFQAANPVVGRYAFWTDDESARINLNTAWKRSGNTNAPPHPSQVDLTALFETSQADAIYSRTGTRFFNSVDEVRPVSSDLSASVDDLLFSLTAYNHSPEKNLFGDSRIVLTTKESLAHGQPFLDILNRESDDPGLLASLDAAKVKTVVEKISAYLRRKDWPMLSGQSLADKYSPVRPEQIALNIIEYVRAAESPTSVVEPILGQVSGTSFSVATTATDQSLIGNGRGPRITEIGVYAPKDPYAPGKWYLTFKIEVYLPAQCGLSQVDLTTLALGLQADVAWGTQTITTAETGNQPILLAGEYRVISRTVSYNSTARPYQQIVRIRLHSNSGGVPILNVAQLKSSNWLKYTYDGASKSESQITTFQINDPWVNSCSTDWGSQMANTLGSANTLSSTLGTTPTSSAAAQQDTDASGLLANGVRFPSPKGSSQNPSGLVRSAGELGFVHTGTECYTAGIPWRTIRLQPQKAGATTLPDWALLDLFTAPFSPVAAEEPLLRPQGEPGGRININAAIRTFTDATSAPTVTRLLPLQGLLLNASRDGSATLTAAQARTLSQHIAAIPSSLASGANVGKAYGSESMFYSPGQIAEVSGIADGGESTEALLREIANLATTRGSVFSIYSVGQTLLQDKTGKITIRAERRYQTVVEQATSTTGSPFRTVFSRELRP